MIMDQIALEVIKWILIVLIAGFIGYFGKHAEKKIIAKFEKKEISIREITENYINDNENGVTGYNGKLNIRPKYQREFVYKDTQRNAVIQSIRNNFPLNTMYWVKNSDDNYEVLDGQQRTISVCEYVQGNFSINYMYFHNLEEEEKEFMKETIS